MVAVLRTPTGEGRAQPLLVPGISHPESVVDDARELHVVIVEVTTEDAIDIGGEDAPARDHGVGRIHDEGAMIHAVGTRDLELVKEGSRGHQGPPGEHGHHMAGLTHTADALFDGQWQLEIVGDQRLVEVECE